MLNFYINNKQMDMFEDETIKIVTKLKDARDITKLYGDFTQQFSVPANGNNNLILGRYPDSAIVATKDMIDYRKPQSAVIEVDGVIYKGGYAKYNKAVYKEGKLAHHLITFTGSLLSLPDKFGDKTLQDLDLSEYDHLTNATNVRTGMAYGEALFGDKVVYPLMSSTKVINQSRLEDGSLSPEDFAPGIALSAIFEAIRSGFGVGLTPAPNTINLDKMYIWAGAELNPNQAAGNSVLTYDSATGDNTDIVNLTTGIITVPAVEYQAQLAWGIDITPIGGAGVTWLVKVQSSDANTTSSDSWTDLSLATAEHEGTGTEIGVVLSVDRSSLTSDIRDNKYYRVVLINTATEIETYDYSVRFETLRIPLTTYHFTAVKTGGVVSDTLTSIASRLPAKGLMEFVKGFLQLYNFVPVVDYANPDEFELVRYDDWLASGTAWDISDDVDITSHTVEVPTIPKSVIFKYQEPKSVMNKTFYWDVNGTGAYDYTITNENATGDAIEVEIPFEAIRWVEEEGTDYLLGYAFEGTVDYNYATGVGTIERVSGISNEVILFVWNHDFPAQGSIDLDGFSAPLLTHKRCSFFGNESDKATYPLYTLSFKDWESVYTGDDVVGTYKSDWFGYIQQLLNETARLHTYSGVIPINKLSQITAASRLKIGMKWFNINAISVDSVTRKATMELINHYRNPQAVGIVPDTTPPVIGVLSVIGNDAPAVPTNLIAYSITDDAFTLSWTASASSTAIIAKYRIYRNGTWVYSTNWTPPLTPAPTIIGITGQTPSSTNTWTVIAEDTEGLISNVSDPISVTQLAQNAPLFNNPILLNAFGMYQLDVIWSPATEFAYPLKEYRVYVNNVYNQTVAIGPNPAASILNLVPGTSYNVRVDILDDVDDVGSSDTYQFNTAADTEPPTDVENLVVLGLGVVSASIGWDAATDNVEVDAYLIYNDAGTLLRTVASSNLSATFAGLTTGQTYTYKVKARDLAGNLSINFSNTVSATPVDSQAPTAPGNLRTTSIGYDTIGLAWNTSTDDVGVAGYRIYDGGLLGTLMADTGALFTTLTGLDADTDYDLTAVAYDDAGNVSKESNEINITTNVLEIPPDLGTITVSDISYNTAQLNWAVPTPISGQVPATGYKVYKGDGTFLLNVAGGSTVTVQVALDINGSFDFKMKASNTNGNISDNFSNTVSGDALPYTPPSFNNPLWADEVSEDGVKLEWFAATPGSLPITHYGIHINGPQFTTVDGSTLEYDDFNVSAGDSIDYYVIAYNSLGSYSRSNTLNVVVPIPIAIDANAISFGSITNSSIQVLWSAATIGTNPLQEYILYRDNIPVYTGSNTDFTDTGLADDTSYEYYVTATDTGGFEAQTNKVSKSTLPISFSCQMTENDWSSCSGYDPNDLITVYYANSNGVGGASLPTANQQLYLDPELTIPVSGLGGQLHYFKNFASFSSLNGTVQTNGYLTTIYPC